MAFSLLSMAPPPLLRPGSAVVVLAALLVVARTGTAQTPGCDTPFDLPIQVRSAQDDEPVVGASIILAARQQRVLTGEDGGVLLEGVCSGSLRLSVSHLAYGTRTLLRDVGPHSTLTLRLSPRAVELEGITVSVEPVLRQLERRRAAVASKSGVFDAADFAGGPLPPDIPAYVAARIGHPLRSCGASSAFGARSCYPYRGRVSSVQIVCVDEAPIPGGVSDLRLFVQEDDIARLEFFPAQGLMRIYTKGFIGLAAKEPWLIQGPANLC